MASLDADAGDMELTHLAVYNCARSRLTMPAVEHCIAAGRFGC
jgi:hypothetical protein